MSLVTQQSLGLVTQQSLGFSEFPYLPIHPSFPFYSLYLSLSRRNEGNFLFLSNIYSHFLFISIPLHFTLFMFYTFTICNYFHSNLSPFCFHVQFQSSSHIPSLFLFCFSLSLPIQSLHVHHLCVGLKWIVIICGSVLRLVLLTGSQHILPLPIGWLHLCSLLHDISLRQVLIFQWTHVWRSRCLN